MQFAYTILYVENVAATLAFYEAAFGFERRMMTPEEDYAELQTGATVLAFANYQLGETNLPNGFQKSDPKQLPFGIELAFTTETLREDYDRAIAAGATFVKPIEQKPWGQQVAYVRDNNGFLVELCTPMG